MLRLMFALPILLLPYALYFPTGIPGLNLSNLLLVLLVLALMYRPRDPDYQAQPGYLSAPLIAMFLTFAVSFVSIQWHDLSNVGDDLVELKNAIFYPLLYFVYRRCGLDPRATRRLIFLVLIIAAIAGLQAVWQGISYGLGQFIETNRAYGPFGSYAMANRAGVFFALFLPMFAGIALLNRQSKGLRWFAGVGAVVLVTAILFTYSRQSYLIALFAVLVLLVLRNVPAAILASLLIVVSVSLLPASIVQRVQNTWQSDTGIGVELDESTASRFEIWDGAAEMIADHPAGVGLGRFQERIDEYSDYRMDAHNAYLLMLAECGVLGFLAMVWLLWRLWLLAFHLRRSGLHGDTEVRALAAGFTLAVIAMALSNVYGSPFFEGLIMANFWILCGLLERYGVFKAQATSQVVATRYRRMVAPLTLAERFPLAARALPGLMRPRRGSSSKRWQSRPADRMENVC